MIDFSENKDSNFKKAGRCFVKAFVFLFLGFRAVVYNVYGKLSKKAVIVISAILLLILSVSWLVCYIHMKTQLTTVEWQRDSLKQKVDSINELNSKTAEYSKFIDK